MWQKQRALSNLLISPIFSSHLPLYCYLLSFDLLSPNSKPHLKQVLSDALALTALMHVEVEHAGGRDLLQGVVVLCMANVCVSSRVSEEISYAQSIKATHILHQSQRQSTRHLLAPLTAITNSFLLPIFSPPSTIVLPLWRVAYRYSRWSVCFSLWMSVTTAPRPCVLLGALRAF